MSTISGLFSGNLFSATNTSAGTKTNESKTSSLLSADETNASEQLGSYMLDLSAAAKAYLAQQDAQQQNSESDDAQFSLSESDKKKIRDIIEQYKNEPLSTETFMMIQEELTKIGLGADQLAAKERINAFNPTQALFDALNGTQTTMTVEQIGTNVAQKRENYLSDIVDYWASISTSESDNVGDLEA